VCISVNLLQHKKILQLKIFVAINTHITTKSLFQCHSTPPNATKFVVLPKGSVAIGGKPCSGGVAPGRGDPLRQPVAGGEESRLGLSCVVVVVAGASDTSTSRADVIG
jgi:hypothetical protein